MVRAGIAVSAALVSLSIGGCGSSSAPSAAATAAATGDAHAACQEVLGLLDQASGNALQHAAAVAAVTTAVRQAQAASHLDSSAWGALDHDLRAFSASLHAAKPSPAPLKAVITDCQIVPASQAG